MNGSKIAQSKLPWAHSLVPLTLLLLCPPFAILVWYTHTHLDGSLLNLISMFADLGALQAIVAIYAPVVLGSPIAWLLIGVFAGFELALMRFLPGATFRGPPTAKGNIPVYKANGVLAYVVTLVAFLLASLVFGWFSPTIIYDNFGPLIGALNIMSLALCVVLYIKGRFFPSSSDSGITGNILFDFYWGTELYPRVFGFDVKMFTNCRFGMMSWSLIIVSFAAKQTALYGLTNGMIVAVALQLLYVAKFFWWETGYLSSLDIMHDRAGFYICWGCLVWVPSVYTSSTLYLVDHPLHISNALAAVLFLAGTAFVFVNYFADRQRQRVRQSNGECKIWGRKPEVLVATYTTEQGQTKQSLLLLSGFWGLSRHFHYLPEVLAALCWSLPAGFTHGLPYFYVVFLAILLTHRALRDDERCSNKYGTFWQQYCERVPSRIIPGVW